PSWATALSKGSIRPSSENNNLNNIKVKNVVRLPLNQGTLPALRYTITGKLWREIKHSKENAVRVITYRTTKIVYFLEVCINCWLRGRVCPAGTIGLQHIIQKFSK